MTPSLQLIGGDAISELQKLPDDSVHCVVTSPPYWNLRDYGTAQWEGGDPACEHFKLMGGTGAQNLGKSAEASLANVERSSVPFRDVCGKCGARRIDQQIGLEKSPEEWCDRLVELFREVRRVLHPSGVVFLNVGDAYCGSGCGGDTGKSGLQGTTESQDESKLAKNAISAAGPRIGSGSSFRRDRIARQDVQHKSVPALKAKDLIGLPWQLAFALRNDGWWLRQDIVWSKPNPMPESVTDRCTKSHEYIFLLTKESTYFYDNEAIKEPVTGDAYLRRADGVNPKARVPSGWDTGPGDHHGQEGRYQRPKQNESLAVTDLVTNRNKRSVWSIASEPYPGAHFATFPTELPKLCILAGTSARGVCPRCLAPWERIVEDGLPDLAHQRACGGDQRGNYSGQATKDYEGARAQDASATKARILRGMVEKKTIGWKPTCLCGSCSQCGERIIGGAGHLCLTENSASIKPFDPIPATVLDPFAGTATTCAVALELGRSAIGIELSPDYLAQAQERCAKVTPGLPLY